ncbi:Hypothetical predicted protein [Mytilus galloprovincialis]|uniref:DZIP3-like HEPN domain-containing protein n=1 Tax=Mytilus galloprovincialis TaxID=29158 RepID=A0A8B6DQ59_MYTGA|nr:Hypothetical predicted protein [Mytilus galloprovincialis]
MDHYKTGNHNYITKECLCRIIAKQSNVVDCMDISLMYAIIQSCYIKHNIAIHGNPRCIEAIKDTRNFLAHVPSPRISKSEFDTRWAETEQAILEIGSSLGQYFAKVNQKKIEAFKRNDVSIEGIKGIIENNIDEIIKKKLQTFIEDQRTNAVTFKDEISEQLFKYKEEMKIEIRNLIFEVKQDAVAPCDIEKTFDSPGPRNNATACGVNVEETEEGNINATKRRVEWKLATPSTWNLPEIKDTLKKCSAQLRQWFEIENVFVGSLVIKTLVQQNVLDNREEFRASVHLFLEKFVEVCRINADVPTVIKVDLIIELGEFEKEDIRKESAELDLEMGVPVAEQIIDDSVNKAQVATGKVISMISHKTYFARLGHATYQLIPNMIRELLAHFIHPNTLYETVNKNYYLAHRLKSVDWKIIHDVRETGYRDLDYPLIYTIIRNCLPFIQPSKGWDYPVNPQPHETSLGDDIERCRRYRNLIIHRLNTTVSYQELNEFFSELKSVARRFEIVLGKEPNEFVSQFDVLKTCSMDEDI